MLVLAMALTLVAQGPTGGYLFQEPSPASPIRGLEGDAASRPVLGLREALDRCYAWAAKDEDRLRTCDQLRAPSKPQGPLDRCYAEARGDEARLQACDRLPNRA
jgi:hypothetical protein